MPRATIVRELREKGSLSGGGFGKLQQIAQARRCTPASHHRPRISTLPNERQRHRPAKNSSSGGRTWWAHFEFTRINVEPIILRKKIEEQLVLGAIGFGPSSSCIWKYQERHAEDSRPILET
jgi:hypothetical protein